MTLHFFATIIAFLIVVFLLLINVGSTNRSLLTNIVSENTKTSEALFRYVQTAVASSRVHHTNALTAQMLNKHEQIVLNSNPFQHMIELNISSLFYINHAAFSPQRSTYTRPKGPIGTKGIRTLSIIRLRKEKSPQSFYIMSFSAD